MNLIFYEKYFDCFIGIVRKVLLGQAVQICSGLYLTMGRPEVRIVGGKIDYYTGSFIGIKWILEHPKRDDAIASSI